MHPREVVVRTAELEIDQAVAAVIKTHALTYGEVFRILAALVASSAKYLIREERHGDAETPGGVIDG